jgi:acetyl esterase/lipase
MNSAWRRSHPCGFEVLEGRALLSAGGRAAGHGGVFFNLPYENVGGRVERLDVDVPAGPVPSGGRPALLAIHGGGWRKFDKVEYGSKIAGQFGRAGYVVVAMNYALSAPGRPSWPANINDVRAASLWVHQHAAEFGINPRRVAAIGESAGGHLATLLGLDPGDTPSGAPADPTNTARVAAVIDFYGPTDLTALVGQSVVGGPVAKQFLGGTPEQVPASYRDASPVAHVTGAAPPVLMLHGTADTVVPLAQAQELASALTAAGVPNRLVAVPGASHGFEFAPSGRKLRPEMLAFLDTAWNDKG